MSDSVDESALRSQRIKLLVILGIFALPVILASLWHANSDSWRPSDTSNYGELIIPVKNFTAFTMPALDGTAVTDDFLRGRWTLVYIGAAECDEICRTSLYNMRQIRLALNEKMDRVQRLWVLSDNHGSDQLSTLLNEHPGLKVAQPDSATRDEFLKQFSDDAGMPVTGRVYVVDPLGNLMMRYPSDANPKRMLKDIEKLLKASWIG